MIVIKIIAVTSIVLIVALYALIMIDFDEYEIDEWKDS